MGHDYDLARRHLRRDGRHSAPRSRWPGRTPALIRLDSGDLPRAGPRRPGGCLDRLGVPAKTRIVAVTSDLDEFADARGLSAAPIDGYGVGTSLCDL